MMNPTHRHRLNLNLKYTMKYLRFLYRKIKPDLRPVVKLPNETDAEFLRSRNAVRIVDIALWACLLFLIYVVTQI